MKKRIVSTKSGMRYDTLVRAIGPTSIERRTTLFGNTNVGSTALSNMECAGMIPCDREFEIREMRVIVDVTEPSERGCREAMKVSLNVNDKVEWHGPADPVIVFEQPIQVYSRGYFSVGIEWFEIGGSSSLSGPYRGDVTSVPDQDILEALNESQGRKHIKVELHGEIRDVEFESEVKQYIINGEALSGDGSGRLEAEKWAAHLSARERLLGFSGAYVGAAAHVDDAIKRAEEAGDQKLADLWKGRRARMNDAVSILDKIKEELW